MNSKEPLISSYFAISGKDLKPEFCTSFIGLTPSNFGYLKAVDKYFWDILIDKKPCYCIDEAINEIIDILWPKRHKIKKFLNTHNVSAALGSNVTIH